MGELSWGIPLFFDLWVAGMAGGAYFAAFLTHLFGADEDQRLLKLATYLGVPMVLLGVLTLVVDLGEPLRFWHLYVGLTPYWWQVVPGSGAGTVRAWPPFAAFYPLSPMSLGSWILVIWTLVAMALIVLWYAEGAAKSGEQRGGLLGWVARVLRPLVPVICILRWIGFVFAILIMTYTGVVLSVSSRALWSATLLVPALFVTSATATGVAALIAAVKLAKGHGSVSATARLNKALAVLIIVQLVVLAAFLVWLAIAGEAAALVSGVLGLIFWVGVVALGLVAPLLLQFRALKGAAEEKGAAVLVSPILVLLGGFVLRAVVVIGGQI